MPDPRNRWTEEELEVLRESYQTASRGELTRLLPGRTWVALRTRAMRMGLSRDCEGYLREE